MADHIIKTSPQVYARIGGVLYLIIIVAGIAGEIFIRGKLIVPGDATATANNIMASQLQWRAGITGDLVMHICDIPLMFVFYVLMKPVNKNLALLAVLFNLLQTAVLAANKLNLFAALFLLGNSDYLKAFEPHQLHALSYLSIRLHAFGFGIGLVFFGFTCLVLGHLISRSGYLTGILGILMQLAGLCYLTNSFALFLVPKFAATISPAILLPAFVAEASLCLWLLVKGVNVTIWEEKANANNS